MTKWKCEICGNGFENFHAQGFDHKIYCPLCYFKKENQELKKQLKQITKRIRKAIDNDEDYLLEVLFDIQDIIKDEEDQKLQYEKYIKPYIEGSDKQ